jgi:hypothetical protein
MATVNKNFVIKNGLEVDISTLVVDATNNRVGINTTNPSSSSLQVWAVGGAAHRTEIDGRSLELGVGVTNLPAYIDIHTADDVSGYNDYSARIIKGGGTAGGLTFVNRGTGYINFSTEIPTTQAETNRLVISSDGNVGIGSNIPASKLHVEGGATWLNRSSDTSIRANVLTASMSPGSNYTPGADPGDTLRNTSLISKGSTRAVIFSMRNIDDGAQAFWDFIADANTDKFYIQRGGAYAPAISWDTSGNVGIGTTTSDEKLRVQGNIVATGTTSLFGGSGQAGTLNPTIQSIGKTLTNVGDVSYNFSAYNNTGNSEYLITLQKKLQSPNGWMSSPWRLQRLVDSTWMSWIGFGDAFGNAGIRFGGGTSTVSPEAVPELMCIRSDGAVGIGTTIPTAKLDVVGLLNIRDAGSGNSGILSLQGITGSGTGCVISSTFATGAYGPLYLKTNNKDTMILFANNNVGMGTTSATISKLFVDDVTDTNGSGVTIVGSNQLLLKPTYTSNETVIHRNDGTNYYILLSNAGTNPSSVFNSLRPFYIQLNTGNVTLGHAVTISGTLSTGQNTIFRTPGAATSTQITARHYQNIGGGTLSFEGTAGQLFSISNEFADPLFTVSDASGIPSIEVNTNGNVQLAPYGGNVGIGTTNPSTPLHILYSSNTAFDTNNIINGGTNNNIIGLTISNVDSSTNPEAAIFLTAGNSGVTQHSISVRRTGVSTGDLIFRRRTSAATLESMRILNNGNVGIGTTNPTEKLHVIGNILASGTITGSSDIKFKTNIQTIPNALDKVLQLRGVEFDRIDMNGEHQIGVIAQEIEKIIPEVVYGEDGTKSVAYGNIVAVLIEAIKELSAEVESLKTQLNSYTQN